MSKVVSVAQAEHNLKSYIAYIAKNNDHVIIAGDKEDDDMVIISKKELDSINETLYLLSSANNRKHLEGALKEDRKDQVLLQSKDDIKNFFKKYK